MTETKNHSAFDRPQVLFHQGWTLSLRSIPARSGQLPLLLLHGWTGDEHSLWDIARHTPQRNLIIAPRGPYADPKGGYAWREIKPGTWGLPEASELQPAAESLVRLMDELGERNHWDCQRFDVVGYSQGAVLTLILALTHPTRLRKIGLISGFMPKAPECLFAEADLSALSAYVVHGTRDEQIPIRRARDMVDRLQRAEAAVEFMELNYGHRVPLDQLTGLFAFLSQG